MPGRQREREPVVVWPAALLPALLFATLFASAVPQPAGDEEPVLRITVSAPVSR